MPSPVSLLVVTVLSSLMSMAVLASLRAARIDGVSQWLDASALSVVALLLFAFQGRGPALATVVIANTALAGTALLVLQGCRRFFGLPAHRLYEYVGLAALAVAVAYLYYVRPNIDARIVVVSIFHAYVYARVGWLARTRRPPGRTRYAYRFVAVAAWLGAGAHLLRGFVYGARVDHLNMLQQGTSINVIFLTLGILVLPCLSIGMVLLAHDRMAERLERLANVDELTGVLARRALLARAEALLANPPATGACFVAIIDIDHFKSINDGHGHGCGDQVLSGFAAMVAQSLGPADVFGRLGGEEFALFFVSASRGEAVARLERLREAVAGARFDSAAGELDCTFSAGLDQHRPGESLAAWMAHADAALYVAKALGRNRLVAAWAAGDAVEGAAQR